MSKKKRILDFIFSLVLLIILSPLLLLIYVLVAFTSDGSPLLKQLRMGKDEKPFYIYKFRSMRAGAPILSTTEFHDSDRYVTGIGRILRKTSLDELPQLLNILNGTMSFVGPRPVIVEETDLIRLRSRHGIYGLMPGLTGWAQVNGRDNLDNEEKVRLDREYLKTASLKLDARILVMTFFKVFRQSDIKMAGADQMAETDNCFAGAQQTGQRA